MHRGDVEQVSGELEGDAETLAIATHALDGLGWAAAEHRAVARSRRDEHTRLVGKDAQVVVDRVDALGHRSRVADLTTAQTDERLCLDSDSLWPQSGDKLGCLAEEQVADQDRVGVSICGIDAD